MDLIFINNSSPENAINKDLSEELTINIFLKRDVDITSPTIILKKIEGVEFRDYNYASIPVLERFYFIRSVESLNNSMVSISLECDVLETFKQDYFDETALIEKTPESGDFGQISLNFTGDVEVTNHESDVSLETGDRAIFNVLRWQ